MRRDLDVLVLCDAALDASRAAASEEKRVEDTFIEAKAELTMVLREIVKQSKTGLRGHDACSQKSSNYNKESRRIFVTPGTHEGPYIDGLTGDICDCKTSSDLVAVWRALPGIMSQHIAACEADREQTALVAKEMAIIWHGSQALHTFAQEVMPGPWKRSLMDRALNDVDLQDALVAAAATDDPHAPLKMLRDQVEEDEPEGEEVADV
jgi:hypothetical protein